ncbi:MAG: hypothetical protein ACXWRE_12710, partial [Pseudobdellovibrionaceae bacterium]
VFTYNQGNFVNWYDIWREKQFTSKFIRPKIDPTIKYEEFDASTEYASNKKFLSCITPGPPTLWIAKNDQYSLTASYCANPGEPGTVFIIGHEISTNELITEVSSPGNLEWSKDKDEVFHNIIRITLKAGYAGQRGITRFKGDFLAKFDVVFHPNNGQPDKVLISKIYKMHSIW